jgi:hypothetical protein
MQGLEVPQAVLPDTCCKIPYNQQVQHVLGNGKKR